MKRTAKLLPDPYRAQRVGRGRFVMLVLRPFKPIVPVAVVGGEDTQPPLVRLDARTSASARGPSAWTAGANFALAYALETGARLTAELGQQVVHLSDGDTTTPGLVGRVSFVLGL